MLLIWCRASWVKSGECRCCLPGTVSYDDCVVELEWVGSQTGSLEAGTLSILTIDKAHTRVSVRETKDGDEKTQFKS